jgi:hypothetical protein
MKILLLALLALAAVPSAASRLEVKAPITTAASTAATSTAPLTYHNGKVMRTQVIHNVYWQQLGKSYGPTYRSILDRFTGDIAADSGRTSNVFSAMTQYGDTSGPISYAVSFAGSLVDTAPYPHSPYACPAVSTCVNDIDIQAHLWTLAAQQGWATDYSHAITVYLPQDVGVYVVGSYSYSGFCGYHRSASKVISHQFVNLIYNVVPYSNWAGYCQAASSPNNDPSADKAVSTTSHELIEEFTNPAKFGWFDANGLEIADKCQGQFGTALGSTDYGLYNQSINGNPYYLQGEWSNAIGACAWGG